MNRYILILLSVVLIQYCAEAQEVVSRNNDGLYITKYKNPFPEFSISPYGGAIFPTGVLNDNYKPSPTFGMDLGYRVNKEVGLYAKLGYVKLNSKTDGIADANYFEFTIGPRYYFSKEDLKSNIFLEGGIGAFTFSRNTLTIGSSEILGSSNTRMGMNGGIGATMALTDKVRILVKSKYTMIFTPTGSDNFVTVGGGLEFIF